MNKSMIGAIIAATAATVTHVVSSADERKKLELEVEREKNRNEMLDRERERQLIVSENEKERRYTQMADIRKARMEFPLVSVCPRCVAEREIDRVKGVMVCPYCRFVEQLPPAHRYNADLDDPLVRPTESDIREIENDKWKKSAKTAYILGIISIIVLGSFLFTEIVGLIMANKVLKQQQEAPEVIDDETERLAKRGQLLNVVSLICFVVLALVV